MLVYKILNKINGKEYIGQTIHSLEKRWYGHCNGERSCRYLRRAIEKYGKDNFKIKVLARCNTREEMDHREAYYIKLFNTLAPSGYNLDSGGKNKQHHEDSLKVMREKHKGQNNANFGRHHSEEIKEKIRQSVRKALKIKRASGWTNVKFKRAS